MTDCVFNGDNYRGLAQVGLWRIDAFVSKDGVTKAGVQYFASVTKKE